MHRLQLAVVREHQLILQIIFFSRTLNSSGILSKLGANPEIPSDTHMQHPHVWTEREFVFMVTL